MNVTEALIDGELTAGRDFELYARGMDVGLALKLSDMVPHLRPGRIVDKGCGTGALMMELATRWPGAALTGVDLSSNLLEVARAKTYATPVEFVRADVTDAQVGPGQADSIIFSSVVHEVYSYSGYSIEAVRKALASASGELRPGGRVVVRDGIGPVDQEVTMSMTEETFERFLRFSTDFRPASSSPGVPFTRVRDVNGHPAAKLSLVDASEFLSKKDYLENWDCEVQEAFCYATASDWEGLLADAGLVPHLVRSYSNPWIIHNRYQEKAWIYDRTGELIDFPPTNVVVVGEKPTGVH